MEELNLWALFVSAFVSSTLFPGGSEVLLGALAMQKSYAPIQLLAVASVGNTLGGMSSWLLGWLIAKRYPTQNLVKPNYQTAISRLRRWGSSVLLLSWAPVIGDPLCVAAGWLRLSFFWCLVFIALGKTLRYAFILFITA